MGPSREACDRCHAMKTRCVRAPEVQACVRCTRLGFSCHYSPPGRTGRPVGSKRANKTASSEKRTDKTFASSTPRTSPKHRASSSSISSSSASGISASSAVSSAPSCKQIHQHLPQPDELSALFSVPTTINTSASSIASSSTNYTASTASIASTAGAVHSDYHDVDFFNTPLTGPDDESMNLFFMDDFTDMHDPLGAATAAAATSATTAASTVATSPSDTFSMLGQSEHQSLYPDPNPKASTADFMPYAAANDDELLHRLLDIQTRLAKLNQCLSGRANDPSDVEDIYHITETVITILDSYDEQNYHQQQQPLLPSGNGVIVLLLSSCYVSLIQAYECLANALRRDLQPTSNSTILDTDSINMMNSSVTFPGMMPSISVGAVRLSMPPKAMTEVNLHLVGQAVQRLKASMANCASRMAIPRFLQASSASSLAASPMLQSQNHHQHHHQQQQPQRHGSMVTDGGWNLGPSAAQGSMNCSGFNPITDLTEVAMTELRMREENMFVHLQSPAF